MNGTKTNGNVRHESFFLTDLLDARAYLRNRRIGTLKDVVAVDRERMAEVTHIQIARPFGNAPLVVPLANVRSLTPHEVIVDLEHPESYVRELLSEEVLLRDYLLDKKVLDVEDREVEVVYDMRLVITGDKIYVTDVDISPYGLLRRLGLKRIGNYFYKRAAETKQRLIPWSYVEPLPAELGTLQGNLKLTVLKERLTDIHPADLADMLEELDSDQRVTLLEGLDTEHASDTLEEIDPAVQRDIVFSLRKERVAQLISEMTPGQAADIVSVLPADEKRMILKLLETELVEKIEEIIEKQDVSILDFTTANFFRFHPETTVGQARSQARETGRTMDVSMYLYIVADNEKLAGVVSVEDAFMAADDALLKQLMVENVISLRPDSTMQQATNMFVRYGFRALPVSDENDTLLGVVPYRDVMHLKHRILE
jgi:magnesium transporter